MRKITDVFVIFFACWTVCSHLVIWSGFSFIVLLNLFAVSVVVGVLCAVFMRQDASFDFSGIDTIASSHTTRLGLICSIAVLPIAYLFINTDEYLVAWICSVAFFIGGWIFLHRTTNDTKATFDKKNDELNDYILVGISIILPLLAYVFTSRPDLDDSLYINLAIRTLDSPELPVFGFDYLFPSYKAQSYELLMAALSFLLSREPIEIAHAWLPIVAIPLSIAALARLFNLLACEYWSIATLVCVTILLLIRDTNMIYGNFAFFRIFQGKSWLVTIAVPLIIVYSVRFYAKADIRRWGMLVAVQIASIGLSANALYVAPFTASLALFGCLTWDNYSGRKVLLGLSACFYPVILGVLILVQIKNLGVSKFEMFYFTPVELTIREFFGRNNTAWLWFLSLLASWAVVRSEWIKKWLVGYCLLFTALFLSPLWDSFLAHNVTGPHVLWRLLWCIPLAPILTISICECFIQIRKLRFAIMIFAIIGSILLLDNVISPSGDHQISKSPIRLKVPQEHYAIAKLIVDKSNSSEYILAPEYISGWVPTFRAHPNPLISRVIYHLGLFQIFGNRIDKVDWSNRLQVLHYISGIGRPEDPQGLLLNTINRYNLAVVVVSENNPWKPDINELLVTQNYCSFFMRAFQIYLRSDKCSS